MKNELAIHEDRALTDVLARRLRSLKHGRPCEDCSARATMLASGKYLCSVCAKVAHQRAWRSRMGSR